jgi:hypothetical protein
MPLNSLPEASRLRSFSDLNLGDYVKISAIASDPGTQFEEMSDTK